MPRLTEKHKGQVPSQYLGNKLDERSFLFDKQYLSLLDWSLITAYRVRTPLSS